MRQILYFLIFFTGLNNAFGHYPAIPDSVFVADFNQFSKKVGEFVHTNYPLAYTDSEDGFSNKCIE